MSRRRYPLRVVVWDLDESLSTVVATWYADAEVLVLRNSLEAERVRRIVADFLPDVVVCGGIAFRSLSLNRHCATPLRRAHTAAQDTRTLDPRYRRLLLLLYRGLTNNEIAQQLGVSTRTVKGYLSHLFTVFDVSNRTELVGAAADLGVIDSGPDKAITSGKAAAL